MQSFRNTPSLFEFIALMAGMSSLMALSIDAMLPALPQMGLDLGVAQANQMQLVISSLFAGTALGLLFFGPMSDAVGRKPPLFFGLAIYLVGCGISIWAQNLTLMLAGRVIQGFGLAAPRAITMAIVRDKFHGEDMAKVMSYMMMIFILVPALAPALGQGVLYLASWRAIFVLYLVIAGLVLVWFGLRQTETLPRERRHPFTFIGLLQGVWDVVARPQAMGPTLTMGIVFGSLLVYLSTAQQVFQGLYHKGEGFALYFGMLALCFGFASMFNARLVNRFGMQRITHTALVSMTLLGGGYYLFARAWGGVPPFWSLMLFLALFYLCIAALFGNLNAMAMEPLGHIAGLGAAVIGTLSTAISVGFGVLVGQQYDNTLLPLIASFGSVGVAGLLILAWSSRWPVVTE